MSQHSHETRMKTAGAMKEDTEMKETEDTESQNLDSTPKELSPQVTEYQRKKVTDFTWVQCDNKKCQKWRRIPLSEADNLDEDTEWKCSMNSDKNFNSCQIDEEDYAAYDKLAKKIGLKYVMSQLPEGSLVWGKMTGYCRWPALITCDPLCGLSVEEDQDGDPDYYHVEYLGSKHTHGWIKSKKLEVYGHRAGKNTEKEKQTCRTKHKALCLFNQKHSLKNKYKRMPVEEAIVEADKLLPLSLEERLTCCTYKTLERPQTQGEDLNTDTTEKNNNSQELIQKESKPNDKVLQNSSENKFNQKETGNNEKLQGQKRKKLKDPTKINKKSKKICKESTETSNPKEEKKTDKENNMPEQTSDANEIPQTSAQNTDLFNCENLNFKSTLLDKSKEEKFKIDVEMYKKNEKAFDHDLRRFMARNNLKISKTPKWQPVPIGLFQFFLAVHERGGYEIVSEFRLWTSVYKELTETTTVTNVGAAKTYYRRNIYPYELYVMGKDVKPIVEELQRKKKKKETNDGTKKDSPATKQPVDGVVKKKKSLKKKKIIDESVKENSPPKEHTAEDLRQDVCLKELNIPKSSQEAKEDGKILLTAPILTDNALPQEQGKAPEIKKKKKRSKKPVDESEKENSCQKDAAVNGPVVKKKKKKESKTLHAGASSSIDQAIDEVLKKAAQKLSNDVTVDNVSKKLSVKNDLETPAKDDSLKIKKKTKKKKESGGFKPPISVPATATSVVSENVDLPLDEDTEDLEAMLNELEKNSSQLEAVDILDKDLLDVTFHDETREKTLSPHVKLADTASEFGQQLLPVEKQAQMVPTTPAMSFASEDFSQEEEMLHELQVMDKEFDALEQEMIELSS